MRCRSRHMLAVLLSSLLATVVGAATPEEPAALPFGEVIDVPLVEVEVVVTRADGAAVTDLGRNDFSVFEDDVRVDLAHFERIQDQSTVSRVSAAAGAPEAPGVRGGERGLNLAIFLDEVHVGAGSRKQLLSALTDSLDARLNPEDRVALAAYDGTVRILLPFTNDRRALRTALRSAENLSLSRLMADQERTDTLEKLSNDAAGNHGWSPCLHIAEYVDYYSHYEHQRTLSAISAFSGFVDSLAALSGRKAVFHVSDGIPLRAGADMAEHALELCNGVAMAKGQPDAAETGAYGAQVFGPEHHSLDSMRYDSTGRWEELTARASAGNVSLYTFQAGMARGEGATASDSRRTTTSAAINATARANRQEPLFRMADQTGGRAFLSGAFADGDVGEALGELRTYYLLAYAPPRAADGRVRRIRVAIDRPDVAVRHRKLYTPLSSHQRVASQLLARLLFSGAAEAIDADAPRLELISQQLSESRVKARFRLRVPLADLARIPSAGEGAVEQALFAVFVAATERGGGSSGVRQTLVPVRLPASGSSPQREFVWEMEMLLRPGRQRVGVAVRDEIGGRTTFAVQELRLDEG